MAEWKSKISGPRFARLGTFLRDAALATGVEIQKEHEKGILHEDIYFTIYGTEEQIDVFRYALAESVKSYNSD